MELIYLTLVGTRLRLAMFQRSHRLTIAPFEVQRSGRSIQPKRSSHQNPAALFLNSAHAGLGDPSFFSKPSVAK